MEQGIGPHLAACGVIIRGWTMVMRGEASTGVTELRRGLDGMRATGTRIKWSYYLALLGEACHRAGLTEEGLAAVADAQRFVEAAGERMWETEVCRLKGELLLGHSASDYAEAEVDFRQAAELARQRGARSSELRAAMSLACLWRDRGRRAEARELLAPICGWFTEGFDTPDLKEARALLEELCE
jgi:predicted ATPase